MRLLIVAKLGTLIRQLTIIKLCLAWKPGRYSHPISYTTAAVSWYTRASTIAKVFYQPIKQDDE